MSDVEARMRERAGQLADPQTYPALRSLASGGRPGRQWLVDQIKLLLTVETLHEEDRREANILLDWVQGLPSSWWDRNLADEAKQADEDALTGKQQDLHRQLMDITGWWVDTAMKDAERTVPKAVEYGSADFDLMGQFMVALIGDKLNGATDDEKLRVGREMAVAFYLIGKLGRMVGAYATGILPSDDTLFDTSIYSMMLRRIRETGHWVE